ncbi:hypothetical protein ZIOFF_039567 [Zingiber officinale]|uniref:Serine hydrolase domain-containing protein n=1 Tax=Zingiber officinale TaxID=94328 RepID=A0A8J5G1E8_ZINOF|nr:hypothetical protein ZIOFF_039567 [Zingiber officinale]
MGSLVAEVAGDVGGVRRRPRFLCLHGFRTSGEIMRTQVMGKWPEEVTARLDLVFLDGSFPAEGKSDVDGIFPPPYYEWFQFDKDFMEYRNLEECFTYIEDLIIEHGPFDGLMGFSQGAILSAALLGLQSRVWMCADEGAEVEVLNSDRRGEVPGAGGGREVVSGSGGLHVPTFSRYNSKSTPVWLRCFRINGSGGAANVRCIVLRMDRDTDFLKTHGEALLESFVDPFIIRHPKGHTVPKLDDKSLETMLEFLHKIEADLPCNETRHEEETHLS